MKSKQGQFELRKMIYWTVAMIVITMVVLASAMIMSSYGAKLRKVPPNLRAELISLRFVNAPECFAYSEEITADNSKITKRVYPGVIDLSKFNEETLKECYKSGDRKNFNFQLVLGEKILETDNWVNVEDFTLLKNVLVKDGEEIKLMMLKIHVLEKI